MKKFLSIAFIVFLVVSCSKDKRAVKKLEGNWKATQYYHQTPLIIWDMIQVGLTYEVSFDNCKSDNGGFCQMLVSTGDSYESSETVSYLYRITNDGKTLERKLNENASIQTIEILELTNNELRLRQVVETNTIDITLEKQE